MSEQHLRVELVRGAFEQRSQRLTFASETFRGAGVEEARRPRKSTVGEDALLEMAKSGDGHFLPPRPRRAIW